ncbi:MAG: arylsulfatase [bacterium]|nr:arylsulfatase [bacterium]
MRAIVAFAWLLLVSVGHASELPNIVIIYADDMGYGDLGIQNPESKIPTPHLDQLARDGMRFTDGHSSSGICTPSRYALLTGRYHWRKFHGIVNAWDPSIIDDDRLTLAEMLRERGYRTACIGKWHLGFNWSEIRKADAEMMQAGNRKTWPADAFDWSSSIPGGPLQHGFDYYFGDDVPNFPPYTWIENDRVVEAPSVPYVPHPNPSEGAAEGRPGPMVDGWQQDAVMPELTQRAIRWIGQQKGSGNPFFLYWAWTSPHAPIVPVAAWQGKTAAGGYGDYMAQSDYHAGQLLQALDDNGFRQNTIVIFSSDNGPERYAFERYRKHAHASSGPLRGVKRDVWEGGHRVPFVVRWPGVVQAGSVSDGLISQIDLMATIASIAGYQLPDNAAEDSHDQLPLLTGGNSARNSLVHNTVSNAYAIRNGDWLLIDAPSGSVSAMPEWYRESRDFPENELPAALFDLRQDLGQRRNLYADHPQIVQRLRAQLADKRERGEVRSR